MIAHMWIGDGWGLIGMLTALAFLALLALAIVVLLRTGERADTGRSAAPAAIRLLEERYARGEITREEFIERRDVLSARPPST